MRSRDWRARPPRVTVCLEPSVRGLAEALTLGKDHRTYDLSLAILNEEIEHEAWFSEFLNEGPLGALPAWHARGFSVGLTIGSGASFKRRRGTR